MIQRNVDKWFDSVERREEVAPYQLSEIAGLENNLTIHLAAFLLDSCFSSHLQKHLC